jgi:DNA-binding CsgD family transcriptional regulator
VSVSLRLSRKPVPIGDFGSSPDSVARIARDRVESIFESDRMALREAADAFDRASRRLDEHDPGNARSQWHALVSGRWTLVDHYEIDGRRILIARRARHEAAISKLPSRTRQVLAYRAMGQALKFIALELDMSTSTVHRELKRGMAALGLRSSVELARLAVGADVTLIELWLKALPAAASCVQRGE